MVKSEDSSLPEETKHDLEVKRQLELVISKDIEQLKNTKIQEMEELIELKSRKEEARVELDRIKRQIEEEKAKLEMIQASMTLALPQTSPTPQPTQATPPLLSPTSGMFRPVVSTSNELLRGYMKAGTRAGSENVTSNSAGNASSPRLLHSKSTGAPQQDVTGWPGGANFQTNFSAFLPVPTTLSGEKRTFQQMSGALLEQEVHRPGYQQGQGQRPGHQGQGQGQRPGHSQPARKVLRSASNPSVEEKGPQKMPSTSPGKHPRLPQRIGGGGGFHSTPWRALATGVGGPRSLDPYIPTPVVGIEKFTSR